MIHTLQSLRTGLMLSRPLMKGGTFALSFLQLFLVAVNHLSGPTGPPAALAHMLSAHGKHMRPTKAAKGRVVPPKTATPTATRGARDRGSNGASCCSWRTLVYLLHALHRHNETIIIDEPVVSQTVDPKVVHGISLLSLLPNSC